ncbi:ACP S-malonyltransferase [Bacillus sp. DX4.1]|uniref:ACP S-malonyltransferase n=1 Tax=Bacillus sp. DX4.1 TaxID=3055867 RepID=UPI0025A2ACF1|nr:ACP S-malonyltransferase [Bacillus sp. DX4.1]MDM5187013.1 ACP S-malonyltransferase [Bacillus sp. DX4.1]
MGNDVVFMFSGQGSQYYQMGERLFTQNVTFRDTMIRLDRIVKEVVEESIINHIYNKKKKITDVFDRLLYTHPAIFMVEYSLAQVLLRDGVEPNFVLGTSLGEFSAAAIAGIINVEDALGTIVKQAQLIEQSCERGGMLAVLNSPSLFKEPFIYQNSELVSINYDSHFVLAGEREKIDKIQQYLEERGIIVQRLPVSYGFHSGALDNAAFSCKEFLHNKSFKLPQKNFISCLYGKELSHIDSNYFWDVVRKPIKFSESIGHLEEKGDHIYLDIGPTGTLASFAKHHLGKESQSQTFTIMNHFRTEITKLEQLKKINFATKRERNKENMRAFVFPGQGSQKIGMGENLFDQFKDLVAKADHILGYSIKELCLKDPNKVLSQTQYTQPALYVVNALHYLKKIEEDGRKPDFVAGHSLGEYNALFAAGAFNFETGLKLVQKRGELMSRILGGGMAAVIGMKEEEIKKILRDNNLNSIDIVNYNTPSQIVIAGPKKDIEYAQSIFEAAGANMFIVLRVSGAFHSRYMSEMADEFAEYLNDFNFQEIQIPVISNVYARPYNVDIKKHLIKQLNHPVKWTESIRYLIAYDQIQIEEIGPGNVLTKLVAAIQKEAKPLILPKEELTASQQIDSKKEGLSINVTSTDKGYVRSTLDSRTEERNFITVNSLGSKEFKKDYNVKYPYVAGAMYRGVASANLVVKMGKSGMIGYFGTGGLKMSEIEEAITYIKYHLSDGQAYGMNLLSNPNNPKKEEDLVDLLIKHDVKNVEAAAYININSALVRYRAYGLKRNKNGKVIVNNRILTKISRPEVAAAFLSPAPERIVNKLLEEKIISREQAEMLKEIPMADDICAEADSGGHTDHGVAFVLLPGILRLRDSMMQKYKYEKQVRVGAAGGIGTPDSAAAAFVLGADFILTGSINQCTVEAGTSDAVKDLLNQMDIQDTESAPAGDMFEIGARIQVLRKGLFFPARANKLYDLYRQYNSLEEIDDKTAKQIQERYFRKSFDEIYEEAKRYTRSEVIEKAERSPKSKMALIFRWYFKHTSHLALSGSEQQKVDYQIHTGPALGDFNRWVEGTELENWRKRHVDDIAEKIMQGTAKLLNDRYESFILK